MKTLLSILLLFCCYLLRFLLWGSVQRRRCILSKCLDHQYNQFDMTQQGSGLFNTLFLIGSGLNFDAIQTNNGFELRQGGETSIPISIQHTGQLPPLIIERN